MMPKGTLQIAYENLSLDNLELKERIAELEEQLKEEYSRGVRDGLNQAAEIVKNC